MWGRWGSWEGAGGRPREPPPQSGEVESLPNGAGRPRGCQALDGGGRAKLCFRQGGPFGFKAGWHHP